MQSLTEAATDLPGLDVRAIEREIRFVGLKRSGNHAILNWIIRQSRGSLMHFNNVRPEDPYQRWARTTATHPELSEQDTVVFSIEDTGLAQIADANSYPQRDVYPGLSVKQRVDVVLLRDPFNLAASRLMRGGSWGDTMTYVSGLSVAQLWVVYAVEFLGRSAWLSPDRVPVSYNRWCRDRSYREALAARLELDFTDAGFEQVTGFGGGSSFERTRMNGKASSMRTSDRWENFREDPGFRALFRDPLLLDLAVDIFGEDEGLVDFVESDLRPRARRTEAWDRWLRTHVAVPVLTRLRRSALARSVHRRVLVPRRRKRLPMPSRS